MINFRTLKVKGFKSFVEPTEILIENGLTGIVGPNGCGKSNLVEAFRFVMGELSPKQMRGSVTIDLDNKARKAPSIFNENDTIEVTRRIWRGEGSEYRVNGKEVRLKDVQLLFADAATGARSTSMVSQGRVGAIIAAKPEQRRTLLEEAAGITGLHSRRHEAELRLNATENNLERVKDVLKAQDEQLTILKKQSKQAERYKYIQKDITKARARLFYKKWIDEKDKLKNANEKIQSETNAVNDQTQVVAQINVEFEKVQESLPNLRLQESKIAAELQKYSISLENQEKEIERANKKNNNPIIDYLDFEDGLEQAIAAVFSDELIASIDEEQSIFWRKLDVEDSSFNSEITKFSSLIKAPDNLKKKLEFVGLIENKENILEIQKNLKPGQILVSKLGEE